ATRGLLVEAVDQQVRPEFARLAEFVDKIALPAARPEDRPGLGAMPAMKTIYDKTLRIHTSLPLTAQAIHDTGLAEVARINEEMRALGGRALGSGDLAQIQ